MSYDSSNLQGVAIGRSLIIAGVLSILSNEQNVKTWFFIFFSLEVILGYCTVDTIVRAYELGKKKAYNLVQNSFETESWTAAFGTALALFLHYLYLPLAYMLTRSIISCDNVSYPNFDWRPLPRRCIQLTTVQCYVCLACCAVVLILSLLFIVAYISAVRVKDRRGFTSRGLSIAVIAQAAHVAVWMWAAHKDTSTSVGLSTWRTILGLTAVAATDIFMICTVLFWYFFATQSSRFEYESIAIIATACQLIAMGFLMWNVVSMVIYDMTYEAVVLLCITTLTSIEAIFAFFFQISSKVTRNVM